MFFGGRGLSQDFRRTWLEGISGTSPHRGRNKHVNTTLGRCLEVVWAPILQFGAPEGDVGLRGGVGLRKAAGVK